MRRIRVPQLDANLVDVTVTAWRKRAGDRIVAGEIVAELTTDKAAFELESPVSGVLLAVLAAEKSIVPAGYILALVGEPGESDPDAAGANERLMSDYRQSASGQAIPFRRSGERALRLQSCARLWRVFFKMGRCGGQTPTGYSDCHGHAALGHVELLP